MTFVALISLAVLVAGFCLVNIARSPPAASAGLIVASVGAICLVLSGLAKVLG